LLPNSNIAAKDSSPSRKYAGEDVGTTKGAGVTADNQSTLIAALKRRDRSAWSAAVDRHLHEVYGFVFHLVGGDRAVAEDLNQETWLAALDGIDHCDADRGSFRNWLFGIARRRVALHYRRRSLVGNPGTEKGTVPICAKHPSGRSGKCGPSPFPADLGDASVLPEDVIEQVEQNSVVRAAILVLPDDRRKVLMWKYVEGLSVDAIAIRMERTAKAVESLLSRAREQLRGLLSWYVTPCGDGRRTGKESSNE
jgi:RNA polymerase sigma-70 factor, ECF subfamily